MSSKEGPAPKEGRLVVYCTFRMTKKRRKELQSVEECSPLNIRGGWDQRAVRCALDVLRVADLVTRPSPEELLVALSNTTAAARAVEERLREVVPETAFGVATYYNRESDTVEDLLQRARTAAR